MSRFADNDPDYDEPEAEPEQDADEAENQADARDDICHERYDGG